MPTPEGKAIVKALKEAMPVLTQLVDTEAKQQALLTGLQSWLLAEPKRLAAAGKGTTNMLVLLYDRDVLDEDVALAWWAGVSSKHETAAAAAQEARDASYAAIEAAVRTQHVIIRARFYDAVMCSSSAADSREQRARCM